jgi:hypothetical protein
MARRDVTIARGQRTGCFIVYNHAESDRTLARMTHMLTSSSRSASKDARGSSHRDAERTRGQDMRLGTKEAQQYKSRLDLA